MKKIKMTSNEVIIQSETNTKQSSFSSPKTTPMLAPETWDTIFRDIHSSDFLSVINSVPEWNQLLSSRKTVELFPSVLPFVMRFLPKNDFLGTRLICRDWKTGADLVYETHPSRLESLNSDLIFPKFYPNGIIWPTVDKGITLRTIDSFQRFTSEMSSDSGNPFPGRCVLLQLKREKDDEEYDNPTEVLQDPIFQPEYWASVDSLLTQFGEHIWYLRFEYYVSDLEDPIIEMRLRNVLSLVPNLKKLNLELAPEPGLAGTHDDWPLFTYRVVESFLSNPPPKLEKLEVLSLSASECVDYISPVILQLATSYSTDGILKRLDLSSFLYKEPNHLPKLVELSTGVKLRTLPKLKEASPNLEKLRVHFNNYWRDEYRSDWEISTIFDGLHIFRETLKELTICDNNVTCNEGRKNYKVQLPKLERLHLKTNVAVSHFFELKSLKVLQIDGSPEFHNKMWCAELFEQLPKLGMIVHGSEYNRREFVLRSEILMKNN